ncbi:hypothetical protein P167DRAFT_483112 [Morchella conica CCBAS932]|uniref:Phosphoglucomutase-2 n=1 Tax=Morchella conica CCBAS932 TaxID=1392247 RepID=A0A3N4LB98_9PEZI|nr:hypothetical protein P167DRAFT_483112 [Morchella conica CCBAS932]
MEAGFSRMNDLTVIQASQGLADYIKEQSSSPSVVIGHDHRNNSSQFARLASTAMKNKGVKVYLYDGLVHTPLVPFAVNMLNATAGVMITASHNPAKDNGYKVYWSNGCQIIPPHDKNIAQHIDKNILPLSWDLYETTSSDVDRTELLKRAKSSYFESLKGIAHVSQNDTGRKPLRFVYTPMHGVGLAAMERAIADMGLTENIYSMKAQPDPEFPTVRFPNPEEKGALDLAVTTAERNNINLVLASDPDADRFAAAEKLPSGEWKVFTGNQLGVLFAAHTLDVYRKAAVGIDKPISKLAMLASTVSTQMLHAMAAMEGFYFEETLTGFKWLGNRALLLKEKGYTALYAFEEAIGYMFSPVVYDKDGIAAATVFITMAQKWANEGLTVHVKLEQLYKKYGYFESANSYFISPDPNLTKSVFAGIRDLGNPYPTMLGNRRITWWRDLTNGFDSATVDKKPLLPVDSSSQMITCELEGSVRFTVRGSGTEPKIKMYIECKAKSQELARQGAQEVSEALTKEWFRPMETGLLLP